MKKSPETRERMKRSAEERWRKKRAGIVTSLQKVRESALSKIEELFKHWRLSLEETIFVVDAFDEEKDVIINLQQKIKGAVKAVSKASEYLAKVEVEMILIWCMTESEVIRWRVLAETDNTADVVLIEKLRGEYLVETYKEWMSRMRRESEEKEARKVEVVVIEK